MRTWKEFDEENEFDENSKLDHMSGQTRNIGKGDLQEFIDWTLTIDVGQKDEKGYVDALLITITEDQYPALSNEERELEYEVEQFPKGWNAEKVHEFVKLHREKIEKFIDEFTEECESQD